MAYTPTEWTTGDTITAEKLNNMEDGIETADGKQDKLVSGTNIKTVNNTSLLGSGNIAVNSGVMAVTFTGEEYEATLNKTWNELNTALSNGILPIIVYEGHLFLCTVVKTDDEIVGGPYVAYFLTYDTVSKELTECYFYASSSNVALTGSIFVPE